MAAPVRPRSSLPGRFRGRRLLLTVGIVCVAVVLVEVGAVTDLFELLGQRSAGNRGPDLNPYHQWILAITSNITYVGSARDYFPALNGTNLCGTGCPELPWQWSSPSLNGTTDIGIRFYYNVTNTASINVNLSVPILTTTGPVPTLFSLETLCCYSTVNQPYAELLTAEVQFTAGTRIGFEGLAFTTEVIPAIDAGGYPLYVNFTSD